MFKKLIAAAALVAVASGAQATISGEEVTASDFGDQWPLTVDSGRIDCIHPMAAVFVHDETTYQLNGVASNLGYDSINPIWRDNPKMPGTKVNILTLIQAALALC